MPFRRERAVRSREQRGHRLTAHGWLEPRPTLDQIVGNARFAEFRECGDGGDLKSLRLASLKKCQQGRAAIGISPQTEQPDGGEAGSLEIYAAHGGGFGFGKKEFNAHFRV